MSASEKSLRKHLVYLLTEGGAHVSFDAAVKDMPVDLQGKRPKDADHSPWELLEHLRIAQWDIVEFTRNPKHVSPEFPGGYWPNSPTPPDEHAWKKSGDAFRADLKAMIKIVENESSDLFAKIPHGDGQTILREVLVLADHNAYHLGQLVQVRRLLGAWD
ncbi:MAG: transporter [Acidobacteriaceae bacterium]|nr:transporter [Acidobacteriaceae bacterium]